MVDANSISGAGTHNFRVDLGGVIALLSKNLYSGPGVYVRELIQNAMDAIVAREHPDGSAGSRAIVISPYGVESPGSPATEFTITDTRASACAPTRSRSFWPPSGRAPNANSSPAPGATSSASSASAC